MARWYCQRWSGAASKGASSALPGPVKAREASEGFAAPITTASSTPTSRLSVRAPVIFTAPRIGSRRPIRRE